MTDNEENNQDNLILGGDNNMTIKLDSLQGNAEHTLSLITQATRYLHIFSRDLDRKIFDNNDIVAVIKKLALRSHLSRISILLIESRQVISQGHRLLNLAQLLPQRIEIRRPEKQFEDLSHFSLCADGKGYVYRPVSSHYDGVACYHDPRYCRELDKKFNDIWQRSRMDPELRNMRL